MPTMTPTTSGGGKPRRTTTRTPSGQSSRAKSNASARQAKAKNARKTVAKVTAPGAYRNPTGPMGLGSFRDIADGPRFSPSKSGSGSGLGVKDVVNNNPFGPGIWHKIRESLENASN